MPKSSQHAGIIILGHPRSGTTLLRRLLGRHPNIACPGETHILSACARFLHTEETADGVDLGVLAGLYYAGFSDEDVLTKLREFAFSFPQDYAKRESKTRWAEKTAFDSFYIDEIEKFCGNHAYFIGMVRHGLDVAVSTKEVVGRASGSLTTLDGPAFRDALLTLDRDVSTITLTNSSTQTTIYAPSIPADTLGTDRSVIAHIWGTYNNDTGGNRQLDWRVELGGTGIIATASGPNLATSSNDRVWHLCCEVNADGATNDQNVWLQMTVAQAQNQTTGVGGSSNRYWLGGMWQGDAAEDSTAALTLDIQMRHTTAHASLTYSKLFAYLEVR